jgi:putative PIN family toxin of toxin-antitoxin system
MVPRDAGGAVVAKIAPVEPAPRVVIDTNVLLALWIFADPEVDALRAALAAGSLLPVRSAATDAEIASVLARPGLFEVPADRRAALLGAWSASALLVGEVPFSPCRCRDPEDQKFVDLAVAAGARWLLTRDRALLKLHRKLKGTGLAVTTPAAFARAAAGGARSPAG